MRYKALLEYNGSRFSGWQKQRDAKSIQGEIERVLSLLFKEEISVTVAGRTDAGVHALGQVIHFDVSNPRLSEYRVMQAVNNHLHSELVSVLSISEVDEKFDARFSAKKRHYKYRIINRRAPLTVERGLCWHIFRELDYEKMRDSAYKLLGKHDFESFRSSKCSAANAIRTLDKIEVEKYAHEISICVSAKSFLHNQVRIIVGTLVCIGSGQDMNIEDILKAKNRDYAGPTGPPEGLYLVGVDY